MPDRWTYAELFYEGPTANTLSFSPRLVATEMTSLVDSLGRYVAKHDASSIKFKFQDVPRIDVIGWLGAFGFEMCAVADDVNTRGQLWFKRPG